MTNIGQTTDHHVEGTRKEPSRRRDRHPKADNFPDIESFIEYEHGHSWWQRCLQILLVAYGSTAARESMNMLRSFRDAIDFALRNVGKARVEGRSVLWTMFVELDHLMAQTGCATRFNRNVAFSEVVDHIEELKSLLFDYLQNDMDKLFARCAMIDEAVWMPGQPSIDERCFDDFVADLASKANGAVDFSSELLKARFENYGDLVARVVPELKRLDRRSKGDFLTGYDCVLFLMAEHPPQMKDPVRDLKRLEDDELTDFVWSALKLHCRADSSKEWWNHVVTKALAIGVSQFVAERDFTALIYVFKSTIMMHERKEAEAGGYLSQAAAAGAEDSAEAQEGIDGWQSCLSVCLGQGGDSDGDRQSGDPNLRTDRIIPWLTKTLDLLGPHATSVKGDSHTLRTLDRAMQGVFDDVLPQFRSKLRFLEAFKRDQLLKADFFIKCTVAFMGYAFTSTLATRCLAKVTSMLLDNLPGSVWR